MTRIRPTFNGRPATSGDLQRVLDHVDGEMEDLKGEINDRIRPLEDWRLEMTTYGRIIKFTLGASFIGAAVSILNLLGLAGVIHL